MFWRLNTPRYAHSPAASITTRIGSRIAAAWGIGTASAMSGVAKSPAPLPKPPLEMPISRIAGIATA